MKKNQWIDTGTTMVAVLLYMESVYIACSLECGSGICIRRGLLPYRYYYNLGHSDLCHFRYPYWTGKERLCCLLQLLSLFLPSSASYCWLDSVWEMVCQNESSLKVSSWCVQNTPQLALAPNGSSSGPIIQPFLWSYPSGHLETAS